MDICLKLLINIVFNKVNMRMHFLTSLSTHVYYFLCVENDSIYDGEWLWIAKHFIPVTHIFLPGIVPQRRLFPSFPAPRISKDHSLLEKVSATISSIGVPSAEC